MKKRAPRNRKSVVPDFLISPLPTDSSFPAHRRPSDSPKSFNFNAFNNIASSSPDKSVVPDFLISPLPSDSSFPTHRPSDSPKSFNFNAFNNIASSVKKKSTASTSAAAAAARMNSTVSPQNSLTTISDLKNLASSRLDFIKRNLDSSHSEILKELEASQSRLHKRFKIQTQTCQQVMDESDKEYKKISERLSENQEAMKASYAEFITETQASASRVCKTTIPELSQSFKKAIDVLGSRFGIQSA